jgi:drug/metabolite transporter (DMT)-like permease
MEAKLATGAETTLSAGQTTDEARFGSHQWGLVALLFAVAIWGASFVVVKDGLDELPPFQLLLSRFAVATVILLPFAVGRPRFRATATRPGVWLLGCVLFAGLALQTEGLASTSPAHSAFLTSLSVVFVPFLCWFVFRRRPHPLEWIAVGLCAAGLTFVYSGFGASATVGDGLSLLCALAFAFYVLLAERVSRTSDLISAMAIQCLCCFLLSVIAVPFEFDGLELPMSASAIFAVLYVGGLATAAAFGLQLFAQRRLNAVETAIVLTLEPAVATVTSLLLGYEPFTVGLAVGGTLLVVGALVSQLRGADPSPAGRLPPTDILQPREEP